MKPNEIDPEPKQVDQVELPVPPTLRTQLATGVKLFTIAGVLLLALWLVDRIVTS